MNINTNNLVSISEANQNFSKIARKVEKNGSVIILKNNKPKYLLVEFNEALMHQFASDDDVNEISKRLINENRVAYDLLAK